MHDSSPTGATSPLIGYLFHGCLLATGGQKRQTAVSLKVAGGGGRLAELLQNFEVLGMWWVLAWVLRLGVVAGMTELGCACGKFGLPLVKKKNTVRGGKGPSGVTPRNRTTGKRKWEGKKKGKKPQTTTPHW